MSIPDVISAIEKQIGMTPKGQVYVIEVESIPFKSFTTNLKELLESFTSLQYLSINNCALETLENFPRIPSLIRLDLISNNLSKDFSALKTSKYLQTLYLSANQISDVQELASLKPLTNLLQLDLIANPLTSNVNYHEEIFKMLPSLKYLDSKNKQGIIELQSNMSDSLQRVRPDLFSKGESKNLNIFVSNINNNNDEKIKKTNAIRRTNNYKQHPPKKEKKRFRVSDKIGIIFPVSRIRRRLKKEAKYDRFSDTAAVFLTAVLEYMCAEILDVSGTKMKEEGKSRKILPKHLLNGIKGDLELKEFYDSVVIPESEFISKLKLE